MSSSSSSSLIASTQRDDKPRDLLNPINGPALQRRPMHDELLEPTVPRRAELRVDADGVSGLGRRLDSALESGRERAAGRVRREEIEGVLPHGAVLGGIISWRHGSGKRQERCEAGRVEGDEKSAGVDDEELWCKM